LKSMRIKNRSEPRGGVRRGGDVTVTKKTGVSSGEPSKVVWGASATIKKSLLLSHQNRDFWGQAGLIRF